MGGTAKVLTMTGAASNVRPVVANGTSTSKQVVFTTATNLFIGLLGTCTGVISARLLGPDGRGELAAIQTWPLCIGMVATLGLPEALVYFSARDRAAAGRYLASAIVGMVLISFVFMALAFVFLPSMLGDRPPEVITAARLYLLFVPAYGISTALLFAFRGRHELNLWNVLRILPTGVWLAVLLLTLLLHRADAPFIAKAYLLAYATTFIPFFFFVFRRIPGPFRPEYRTTWNLLKFGLPTLLSTVPQVLNFRLDQMLMVGLLPAPLIGLYVVAVGWSAIVNPALYGLGTVLFPKIAGILDAEKQRSAFSKGSRVGFLLSICIAVSFAAVTPWMLPLLFGSAFRQAIPAAVVLIVAASVSGFNIILEEGARGLGRAPLVMWAEFAGLLVTVISLLLLLRPLAIFGAALSSLFGYGAVTIALLGQLRRVTNLPISSLLRPRASEILSICAAIMQRFSKAIGT